MDKFASQANNKNCSMGVHNAGEGVFFHSLTMLFPSFKKPINNVGQKAQPFVALLPFWRHNGWTVR